MQELVPVASNDDYLEVHPSCLAAHVKLGWKECEKREQLDAPAAQPQRPGRKPKSREAE